MRVREGIDWKKEKKKRENKINKCSLCWQLTSLRAFLVEGADVSPPQVGARVSGVARGQRWVPERPESPCGAPGKAPAPSGLLASPTSRSYAGAFASCSV